MTLFNSFEPMKSSGGVARDMPSLFGYGRVNVGNQRQDKRNMAQRGMDVIQSWLSSSRTRTGEAKYSYVHLYLFSIRVLTALSRHYTSPLRAGHKAAHLFTESTIYRYMEDLETPKKWLKANVDGILALYGSQYHISKEDLHLGASLIAPMPFA